MNEWVKQLRTALGIPERSQRLNRRAFFGLSLTTLAALGTMGYAAKLYFTPPPTPTYRPLVHTPTATPQPSASRLRWSYTLGFDFTYSNGIDLSVDENDLYAASSWEVFSLDHTNGSLRWRSIAHFGERVAPALTADSLFIIGQKVLSGDQTLYLFTANPHDGTERQKVALDTSSSLSTFTTVVPVENKAVVQYNNTLAVVDSSTGSFIWGPQKHDVTHPLGSATPAIADGVIYASLWDGNLAAIDLATGTLLWTFSKFASADAIASTPQVVGGIVYFGRNDGYCYAVDVKSQQLLWQKQIVTAPSGSFGGDLVVTTPSVVNDVVFIGGGLDSSLEPSVTKGDSLAALDAKTGNQLWQVHPSALVRDGRLAAYPLVSQPRVLGQHLYLTGRLAPTRSTNIDVLYALNVQDGSEQWHYEVPGNEGSSFGDFFPSAPVFLASGVFFASGDGTIYAFSTT